MKLAGFELGLDRPLFVIAGPCVIESREMALQTATTIAAITARLDMPFVFKASYDKANRTSGDSFRGPGLEAGLEILAEIRATVGCPVLTDVHSPAEVAAAAAAVDVLQIPAFLCRQTDLVQAAAASGAAVNIKKGQFLSPPEMVHVVAKARAAAPQAAVMVCERGCSFGYQNLVVDMRSLAILRDTGCPVVFDATHSVQLPGSAGGRSGGERRHVPVLARAAAAAGVAGIFMETHPDPQRALSDGPNAWPLASLEALLECLKEIDAVVKARGLIESPGQVSARRRAVVENVDESAIRARQ